MLLTIQGLVEDPMYVYQGEIPSSGGDAVYGGGSVLVVWSKIAAV